MVDKVRKIRYSIKAFKREKDFGWSNTQVAQETPLLRAQAGKPARGFKSLLLRHLFYGPLEKRLTHMPFTHAFTGSNPVRVTILSRVVILINENGLFCFCKADKSMRYHANNVALLVANLAKDHDIFATFLAI